MITQAGTLQGHRDGKKLLAALNIKLSTLHSMAVLKYFERAHSLTLNIEFIICYSSSSTFNLYFMVTIFYLILFGVKHTCTTLKGT
jgi:hypothetical protein